jgi:hypothetical protein
MNIWSRDSLAHTRFRMGVVLALAMLAGLLFLARPQTAAANDSCVALTDKWYCEWWDNSLPTNTRRWFNATNNNRNWTFAEIWDNYPNHMQKYCVGIKRASNGDIFQVACGYSTGNSIPAARRPGWVFFHHWASGNRAIHAHADVPR